MTLLGEHAEFCQTIDEAVESVIAALGDRFAGPSVAERRVIAGLPGRRRQTTMGRLTAHAAIRMLTDAGAGRRKVLADRDGAPVVRLDRRPAPLTVSIAHSGPMAAAAVAPPGHRVGVDIEPRDRRNEVLLPALHGPADRIPDNADLTLLFSCTEAAAKANRDSIVRLAAYPIRLGAATAPLTDCAAARRSRGSPGRRSPTISAHRR